MTTIPWIRKGSTEAPVRIMASRFVIDRRTTAPRFLYLAIKCWRQSLKADGVVGVSLRAKPFSRTFWTLSSWQDEQAVYGYAKTDPHKTIMRSLRPVTESARFVFYDGPADATPSWDDALARLAEADAAAAAAGPGVAPS